MSPWTTNWPTEPGWYWTWTEDDLDRLTEERNMRPVQVVTTGADSHLVYIRGAAFLYKEEHKDETIWWLTMDVPPFGTEERITLKDALAMETTRKWNTFDVKAMVEHLNVLEDYTLESLIKLWKQAAQQGMK